MRLDLPAAEGPTIANVVPGAIAIEIFSRTILVELGYLKLRFFISIDPKKLKSEYLPTTILEPIKTSLSKFNEIKEINQSNIQDFYSLLENIPFERVGSIGGYDYDTDEYEYTARRRIYKQATMDSTHFTTGNELRMNYFNFCRVISYIFNSTGELSLDNIQKGINEDTVKKLLGLICTIAFGRNSAVTSTNKVEIKV